jgi:hypothetical protein
MHSPTLFLIFSNVLLCFQSPIKTLEKDTTTVNQLSHNEYAQG